MMVLPIEKNKQIKSLIIGNMDELKNVISNKIINDIKEIDNNSSKLYAITVYKNDEITISIL